MSKLTANLLLAQRANNAERNLELCQKDYEKLKAELVEAKKLVERTRNGAQQHVNDIRKHLFANLEELFHTLGAM